MLVKQNYYFNSVTRVTIAFRFTVSHVFQIKVLEKTENLEVIQIAYNHLSQLNPHFFSANKKLIEINMRNNRLQNIPPNLFQVGELTAINYNCSQS